MAANTEIQWADHTFNPWRGCTKVNAGCTNCYAEKNVGVKLHGVKWGPNGTRVKAAAAMWQEPLKWNKQAEAIATCRRCGECAGRTHHWIESMDPTPAMRWCYECKHCPAKADMCDCSGDGCEQCGGEGVLPLNTHRPRVFCASLADVFEDWPGAIVDHKGRQLFIDRSTGARAWETAIVGDHATWAPLTMDDLRRDLFALIDATPYLDWLLLTKRPENIQRMWLTRAGENAQSVSVMSYRSNVWLGTSFSDQQTADQALPHLLKCRDLAPVLFGSYEPALGPVDWVATWGDYIRSENGNAGHTLDWLIAGGESGPNARPCRQTWIRDAVNQCADAGVSCFVKQLGSNAEEGHGCHRKLNLTHKKGGDPAEWPEILRVRQFPTDHLEQQGARS